MRTDLRITTAIAAALLASGCGRPEPEPDGWTAQTDTAICTDREGRRVADDQCPRQALASGYHGGGGSNAFLWYFLGRNSVIPPYGETARGGSFSRAGGVSLCAGAGQYLRQPIGRDQPRRVRRVGAQFRQRPGMIRVATDPRPDWQAKVEAEGLVWHSVDGRPYWDESVHYRFSAAQIAEIEGRRRSCTDCSSPPGRRSSTIPRCSTGSASRRPSIRRFAMRGRRSRRR